MPFEDLGVVLVCLVFKIRLSTHGKVTRPALTVIAEVTFLPFYINALASRFQLLYLPMLSEKLVLVLIDHHMTLF